MIYLVSITPQGRFTVPINLRRELGLMIPQKVNISEKDGRLIVEPIRNLQKLLKTSP